MIDSPVEINCDNWPIIGHIRSLQFHYSVCPQPLPPPLGFPVTFHNPLPPLSWSLVQATFFIVFNLPALYYSSRECHYDIIPSISQVNESWLVPASYPDVSLDVRAKEGGKETWSLAVHHQSLAFRARLCHAKNEAPEEEAVVGTSLPSLALCFQPRSRPFVWLLAHTSIRKNADCFAV